MRYISCKHAERNPFQRNGCACQDTRCVLYVFYRAAAFDTMRRDIVSNAAARDKIRIKRSVYPDLRDN